MKLYLIRHAKVNMRMPVFCTSKGCRTRGDRFIDIKYLQVIQAEKES